MGPSRNPTGPYASERVDVDFGAQLGRFNFHSSQVEPWSSPCDPGANIAAAADGCYAGSSGQRNLSLTMDQDGHLVWTSSLLTR